MRAKEILSEGVNDIPGFTYGVLSIEGEEAVVGPLTIRYAPSIRGVTFWINRRPVGAIQGRSGDIPKNSAKPYPVMLHGAKFMWYGMPTTAFNKEQQHLAKTLPGATFVKFNDVSQEVFAELLSMAVREA